MSADIAAAQRRSATYGLDPARTAVPHVGDPGPAADALKHLSAPVLDDLISQIAGTSLALVMADHKGRLTRRDASSEETRTAMDGRGLDLGFSLAEADVGTNGVGTSLESRQPTFVVGDNHFLESFHGFTCANAPIIQPITGRVEGTVGVMCPLEDTSALLLPTAMRLSAQISELLLDQATPEERFLLEQFLRHRRSPRSAIATIGKGVLIATPAAQRRLIDVDHGQLWDHLEVALRPGTQIETDVEGPSSSTLRLRCRPLHRGGELEGAAIEFVATPKSPGRRRARSPESLGALVGGSAAWRTVVTDALRAGQLDDPVLVVGERGTGRMAVADAIARQRDARTPEVFNSAEILLDGPREWLLRVQTVLSAGSPVILRRIDQLPDDVAAALALMGERSTGARIIATTEAVTSAAPGLAVLFDRLNVLQIELPALRDRRDDIAPLARHLAARRGPAQVGPQLIDVLYRHAWPGNITELDQALRSALARARCEPLSVQHLPRHLRCVNNRRPLHGLRQQEADAIVAAIDSSTTRDEAAKRLGISRATLFRRIKAYGLDVPR